MSSVITSGSPARRAMSIAPEIPAAGPDSAVRIGKRRARSTEISPPDDWLTPSRASAATWPRCVSSAVR